MRWREHSVSYRESVFHMETDRFERSIARFIGVIAPEKAGIAVKKLAIDLTRSVIPLTPGVSGRARGGWIPFARSVGAHIGVRGPGVAKGMREGSYEARLTGPRPYVILTNAVRYIRPIELGSKPHEIAARRAKALRFIGSDGTYVFRKKVRHPGTRPSLALYRAMRHIRRHVEKSFDGFTRED